MRTSTLLNIMDCSFLDAPTKYSKHALHCFISISLFYSSYKVIKFTYVRCLVTHCCTCIIAMFPCSLPSMLGCNQTAPFWMNKEISQLLVLLRRAPFTLRWFHCRFYPKRLTTIHSHIHTHRRWSQPRRATASKSGAVKVRCLAHGRTSTFPGRSRGSN